MAEQEKRFRGLTAGDAAVILGADPEKSAYTLWAEKRNLLDPEEAGRNPRLNPDLEGYMVRRFRALTGFKTRRVRRWQQSPEYPQVFAWTEHLVLNQGAGLTCGMRPAQEGLREEHRSCPRRYWYHCLHQMMVTGRKKWYLAVLIPGEDIRVFPLTATREELLALGQAEQQFWQRVEENRPPMVDGSPSTLRTLMRLYPPSGGKSVDLSPVSLQVHDYILWRNRERESGETARRMASTIKAYMGNSRRGHLGDIRVQWFPESEQPLTAGTLGTLQVISPEYGPMEDN